MVPKKCSDRRKLTGNGSFIYGGQEFTLSGFDMLLNLFMMAVWLNGNGVGYINELALR